VVYEAVDGSGNLARQRRVVTVVDSCTVADKDQYRCPNTKKCSVFRSCKPGLGGSGSDGGQQTLERPQDKIAPIITILGTGDAYVTSSGGTGLITSVFVGDTYTDAGATALDEVPAAAGAASTFVAVAVITSVLDPSGETVAAVSTRSPT
ncbi:hypothetical protein TSOC_001937, partial [Tetrabaena socialis]